MIATNSSRNTELQVLCCRHLRLIQVTWVEGSGDEDLSVLNVLLEGTAFAFLVRGRDEFVSLLLEPVGDAELVLDSTEETGFFFGSLAAVVENEQDLHDEFELEK